jgi:hypothetical protein
MSKYILIWISYELVRAVIIKLWYNKMNKE